MATFFEKEMRKLFRQGLDFPETVFAGRVCYGKLNTKYRISRLARGELPKYPRLQGFDLDTGCMDGEKLYYKILNEKLQEAGQVPGEEIEIKME